MQNPYAAPNAALAEPAGEEGFYEPILFAINGRIGRLRYLAYGIALAFITVMPLALLGGVLVAMAGHGAGGGAPMLLMVIMYVPILAITFILAKRRLNDLNQSGWLGLLMLIPLLNFFMWIYLVFWPGTNGSNDYGLPPTKNSTGVVILALLMPLFMVIGIMAAISIPAYQNYVKRAQQHQVSMPTNP